MARMKKVQPTKKPAPKKRGRIYNPARPAILRPVPARRFYFAYGSNLSVKSMKARCDSARMVCAFRLPGWRLAFRYVADIEPGEPIDYVPGGIWEITPDDEIKLDRFEGVRYGQRGEDGGGSYRKLSFSIATKRDNAIHDVLVYQMNRQAGLMPPGDWYFQTIVRGYHDFGLDRALLDRALAQSWDTWDKNNLTPDMTRRWDRAGRRDLARRPAKPQIQVQVLPFLDVDNDEVEQPVTEPVAQAIIQLPEPLPETSEPAKPDDPQPGACNDQQPN